MFKSSGIYAIGSLARQLMAFLMLPIYTQHLTPADYGVIEMLTVIMAVLAVLGGVHMSQAVYRFHSDCETTQEKNTLISTACISIFITTLAIYCLLAIATISPLGQPIANVLLGNPESTSLLALFGLIIVLQPLEEQLFTTLRIEDRPYTFVGISLLKLCIQLTLNIYLVVQLELGVHGVVYSAIISTGLIAAASIAYIFWKYGLTFCKKRSIQLMKFAAPLAIGGIGGLYMSISDRYALQLLSGSAAVGLYALAYRFSDVINALGWQPFLQVWQPKRYEIYKQADATDQYQKIFYVICAYLLWVGLAVSLLTDDVLFYMATPDFAPAINAVYPLLLAALFAALAGYFSFIFYVNDKPAVVAHILWISAIVLTIAYVAILPSFGAEGAAWARALAMLVQASITIYLSKKYYDMRLPLFSATMLLGAAACITLLSLYLTEPGWKGACFDLMLLAAFPLLATFIPIFPKTERAWLITGLQLKLKSMTKYSATN